MQHRQKILILLMGIMLVLILTSSYVGCTKKVSTNKSEVGNKKENLINTTESGVLVGFSMDFEEGKEYDPLNRIPDKYRTLWIYKRKGKLNFIEKKGSIITPYGDEFWKIENNTFKMSELAEQPVDNPETIYEKYMSYYNMINLVSHQSNETLKPLFTSKSFEKTFLSGFEGDLGQSYKNNVEWPQFCGNKYISFLSWDFETGGGSYVYDKNSIKVYEIKDLKSYSSRKDKIKLIDLLDEKSRQKLTAYKQKYNKTLVKEDLILEKQLIDINNFALFRSKGKWRVKLPLYNSFQHDGNGSFEYELIDYIDTDISLPETFTGYDTLSVDWNIIKKQYPTAKDAISSPNKDLLIVQTNKDILVFNQPENGLNKPNLVIPVSNREKIVLNQWATGTNVGVWTQINNSLK